MRSTVLAFVFFQLWGPCLGQGFFYFNSLAPNSGIDAPVFDSQGNRLNGSNYLAMLYVGPTSDSFQPVLRLTDLSVAIVPFEFGYVIAGPVEASNVVGGSVAWVQMRAWDARLGGTYDEARQLGLGGYGESTLFQVRAGSGSGVGPIPAALVGLQSFSLRSEVPEPSTLNLLVLPLTTLWFAGRCRKSTPSARLLDLKTSRGP